MSSLRLRPSALFLVPLSFVLASTASLASANAPEDQFGLSARINAMGGAGTALATDPSANYYNPAGLGFCTENQVMLDGRQNIYNLHVDNINANAPTNPGRPTTNQTRATIATCLRLPKHFALGVLLGTGLQAPASFSQRTPNDGPVWAAYDDQNQLSINVGFAYRPIPELSIGAGGAIIVNTDVALTTVVPVQQTDPMTGQTLLTSMDLSMKLKPTGAPYVGILASPTPRFKIGLTYRGSIKLHFDGPLNITATLTVQNPITVDLPLILQLDAFYSPQQLAGGFAWSVLPNLTLASDVTWYQFSKLEKDHASYPFLDLTGAKTLLKYNQIDPVIDWRDVWAIRAGGELRVLDQRLGLRLGYQFRTAMVSTPGSRNTTVLDRPTHTVSAGIGYSFGAPPEARAQPRVQHTPRYRRTTRPGYEEDGWMQASPVRIRARVDAFARVAIQGEKQDPTRGVAYGGQIYDGGLTLTLGWY